MTKILLLSFSHPIKSGLEKYSFYMKQMFRENDINVLHGIRGITGSRYRIDLNIADFEDYLIRNNIKYFKSFEETVEEAKDFDKILLYGNVGLSKNKMKEENEFLEKFSEKSYFWVGAPDEFSIRRREIERGWGFVKEEFYGKINKIFIQRPLPDKFFEKYNFLKKEFFEVIPLPFPSEDSNLYVEEKVDKIAIGIRISFKKQIHKMIDIAIKSNTLLELYGELVNPLIFRIKREAFKAGLTKYLGDFEDYRQVYKSAKFSLALTGMKYCLPSLEYQQLEAISCGAVVIGRDNLIPSEAGIALPYKNIIDSASQIIRELKFNEEERIRIAEKALNFIKQTHSFQNVFKYYKEAMKL
jgi:hypothetical protein